MNTTFSRSRLIVLVAVALAANAGGANAGHGNHSMMRMGSSPKFTAGGNSFRINAGGNFMSQPKLTIANPGFATQTKSLSQFSGRSLRVFNGQSFGNSNFKSQIGKLQTLPFGRTTTGTIATLPGQSSGGLGKISKFPIGKFPLAGRVSGPGSPPFVPVGKLKNPGLKFPGLNPVGPLAKGLGPSGKFVGNKFCKPFWPNYGCWPNYGSWFCGWPYGGCYPWWAYGNGYPYGGCYPWFNNYGNYFGGYGVLRTPTVVTQPVQVVNSSPSVVTAAATAPAAQPVVASGATDPLIEKARMTSDATPELVLEGRNFGTAGQVFIDLGPVRMPLEATAYQATTVRVKLPLVQLTSTVETKLVLVREDGVTSNAYDLSNAAEKTAAR